MGDIGYISQKPSVLAQLRSVGMRTLKERDLLNALHLAILRSRPPPSTAHGIISTTDKSFYSFSNPAQLAIGLKLNVGLHDPKNQTLWKYDARMSRYANTEKPNFPQSSDTSSGSNKGLNSFLSALATDASILDDEQKSAELLASHIGTQILTFMLLTESEEELDVDRAPWDLGVDSLVSIEIRNWWRQTLGLEINMLEILDAKSIRELGKMAARGLREKFS